MMHFPTWEKQNKKAIKQQSFAWILFFISISPLLSLYFIFNALILFKQDFFQKKSLSRSFFIIFFNIEFIRLVVGEAARKQHSLESVVESLTAMAFRR